jgi:hypothetical protein
MYKSKYIVLAESMQALIRLCAFLFFGNKGLWGCSSVLFAHLCGTPALQAFVSYIGRGKML